MGGEEAKEPLKGVDWKAIGSELQKDPSAGTKAVVKKRLPKKIRQILEFYFLPRRSLPFAIAFYEACIAGGVGAGMMLEVGIFEEGNRTRKLERMEASYGSLTTSKASSFSSCLRFTFADSLFC